MGAIVSCCRTSSSDGIVPTPDAETKRRQLVEAAERRRKAEEKRGVKDPERVKQMQQRAAEAEKRQNELDREGGPTLKWTSHVA